MPRTTTTPTHRRTALLCASLATAASLSLQLHLTRADTATWLSPTSGTWSNPANWSTNPAFPNAPSYDVLISATGSAYTLSTSPNLTIGALSLTSPHATLHLPAGTFTATGAINLDAGTLSIFGGFPGNENKIFAASIINNASVQAKGSYSLLSAASTVTNAGTINVEPLATLTISSPTFANTGVISLGASSALTINSPVWSTTPINATGANISLAGAFPTSALSSFHGAPNAIYVTGTLDNTGATLAPNHHVRFPAGSRVIGGTLATSGTGYYSLTGGTLDAVNLDTSSLSGTTYTVTNGLTIAANRSVFAGSISTALTGSQTIAGPGRLLLDGNLYTTGAGPVTLAPDLTIARSIYSNAGTLTSSAAAPIVNLATLLCDTPNYTLTLAGGSWSGNGPIKLSNGTLRLQGSFTAPFLANITQTGGSVLLTGSLDNTSSILTQDLTLGGTITGGTVATPLLTTGPSASLNSLALAAPASVPAGATLTLNSVLLDNTTLSSAGRLAFPGPQSVGGTGTLAFAPTGTTATAEIVATAGAALTVGPSLTLDASAANGSLSGNITNHGLIRATAGRTLTSTATLVNSGTLHVDAATLSLPFSATGATTNLGAISLANAATFTQSSLNFTNAGTITSSNATLNLSGTWSNTGTISVAGGSVTLAGTSPNPGRLLTSAGATVHLTGPLPDVATSSIADSSVRAAAPFTTAQLISLPLAGTSTITLAPLAAINNGSYTLPLTASSAPWFLAGGSITGGSIATPDATPLTATSLSSTLSSLSATAPIVANPGATLTLSSVNLNAPLTVAAGAIVSFTGTTSNNSVVSLSGSLNLGTLLPGTITAHPGSSLTFDGPTSTISTVTATSATLTATSANYTPDDFRSLPDVSSSTFRIGAGALLDLTGDTPDLPNSNTFGLGGGKITGGSFSSPLAATAGSSTLTNTTLSNTTLTLAGGSVTAGPSLTLDNATVRLTSANSFTVPSASPTLSGTATFLFDAPAVGTFTPNSSIFLPATATIGPGISILTGPNLAGSGSIGSTNVTLTNQGTISSRTPGKALILSAAALTNTGTIEARDGGILRLNATLTAASFPALNTLSTPNGGIVQLTSSFGAPNTTLSLSSSRNIGLAGGTAITSTITSADGTPLTVYTLSSTNPSLNSSTVRNATVSAPINVLPAATLALINSTVSSAVTVAGATLNLSGTYSLTAGLSLANNSIANAAPPFTTTTSSIGGTVAGGITLSDSTLNVYGSLNLAGSTISLSPTSSLNVIGSTYTDAALPPTRATTLSNALITGGGLVSLTSPAAVPTLSNVTLGPSTSLLLPQTTLEANIRNGLTLDGGRVTLNNRDSANTLFADSLAGSGEIVFDTLIPISSSTRSNLRPYDSSSLFPLPAGITVRTGSGNGDVTFSTVSGLISAQTPGRFITVNAKSAPGTIEARDGGTIVASSNLSDGLARYVNGTNYALFTGNFNIYDGSTLVVSSTFSPVVSNSANLALSGPTATVKNFSSLLTNAGSITLTDGNKLSLTSSSLTNSGSITLGPSAALKVKGSLSNPGTISLTGGSLLLDYTGPSPIDDLRNQLLTGHLTTPLPNTAIAYFEASLLNLTTYAGLDVDPTTLLTKLTLPGDANLDAQVTPDDYTLLDRSFASQGPNPHWTDGDFNYDGAITAADYLLLDTTYLQAHGLESVGSFLAQRQSQFGSAYVSELLTSIPEPAPISGVLLSVLYARMTRKRRTNARFLRSNDG